MLTFDLGKEHVKQLVNKICTNAINFPQNYITDLNVR